MGEFSASFCSWGTSCLVVPPQFYLLVSEPHPTSLIHQKNIEISNKHHLPSTCDPLEAHAQRNGPRPIDVWCPLRPLRRKVRGWHQQITCEERQLQETGREAQHCLAGGVWGAAGWVGSPGELLAMRFPISGVSDKLGSFAKINLTANLGFLLTAISY